ncbi:hypothetical protein Tco_0691049 [Tanacetum coccineum]
MGIRHAKPYTLRGGPSMKLEQRSDSQTHVLHLHQGLPTKIEIVHLPGSVDRGKNSGVRRSSSREKAGSKDTEGGKALEEAPRGKGSKCEPTLTLAAAPFGRGENG